MNNILLKKLEKSPAKNLVIAILDELGIDTYPLSTKGLELVKVKLRIMYYAKEITANEVGLVSANILLISDNEAMSSSVGADFVGLSEADMSINPLTDIERYLK